MGAGAWRCCCGCRGRTVPTAAAAAAFAAALLITPLKLDGRVGTLPGGNIPAANVVGIARGGIVGTKFRVANACADATPRAANAWADATLLAAKEAAVAATLWAVKVGGPVVGTLVAATFRATKVGGFDDTVRVADVWGRSAWAVMVAVGARGAGASGTVRGADAGTA